MGDLSTFKPRFDALLEKIRYMPEYHEYCHKIAKYFEDGSQSGREKALAILVRLESQHEGAEVLNKYYRGIHVEGAEGWVILSNHIKTGFNVHKHCYDCFLSAYLNKIHAHSCSDLNCPNLECVKLLNRFEQFGRLEKHDELLQEGINCVDNKTCSHKACIKLKSYEKALANKQLQRRSLIPTIDVTKNIPSQYVQSTRITDSVPAIDPIIKSDIDRKDLANNLCPLNADLFQQIIRSKRRNLSFSKNAEIVLIRSLRLYIKQLLFYIKEQDNDDLKECIKLYLLTYLSTSNRQIHLKTFAKYFS